MPTSSVLEFNKANKFNSNKIPYEKALKNSGFNSTLKYNTQKSEANKKRRKRKKQVIYYNPPFSASLKTNIGKEFLKLVDKHFPKNGPLNKIFNRNTMKISYSCMPNIESEISKFNHKVLDENRNKKRDEKTCNCRTKHSCPVEGKCLTKSVIYRATVKHNNDEKHYIGSTGRNFKTRYNEHIHSFRKIKLKESSKLSSYVHNA